MTRRCWCEISRVSTWFLRARFFFSVNAKLQKK